MSQLLEQLKLVSQLLEQLKLVSQLLEQLKLVSLLLEQLKLVSQLLEQLVCKWVLWQLSHIFHSFGNHKNIFFLGTWT